MVFVKNILEFWLVFVVNNLINNVIGWFFSKGMYRGVLILI